MVVASHFIVYLKKYFKNIVNIADSMSLLSDKKEMSAIQHMLNMYDTTLNFFQYLLN